MNEKWKVKSYSWSYWSKEAFVCAEVETMGLISCTCAYLHYLQYIVFKSALVLTTLGTHRHYLACCTPKTLLPICNFPPCLICWRYFTLPVPSMETFSHFSQQNPEDFEHAAGIWNSSQVSPPWIRPQSQKKKKNEQEYDVAITLLQSRWVVLWWWAMLFLLQTNLLESWPKSSPFISPDIHTPPPLHLLGSLHMHIRKMQPGLVCVVTCDTRCHEKPTIKSDLKMEAGVG